MAAHVRDLLDQAGLPSAEDPERGYDHGTFVPLKLAFPDADIPTVQLSLEEDLDPARHISIGRALAPLRDEDVLLVGSGMSFHNMKCFNGRMPRKARAAKSEPFDAWLHRVIADEAGIRNQHLIRWAEAPTAKTAHPREEHLVLLMVMAGAAGRDAGTVAFHGTFAGFHVSGVHFGG